MFCMSENEPMVVRIVETEAYLAENDGACHAATRRTPRNAPMHEAGGLLYVYAIYGIHHCVNIVTEHESRGCAVLLRAAEPVQGTDLMRIRRGEGPRRDEDLLKGPGNFAKALGLGLDDNYRDCASDLLWFEPPGVRPTHDIVTTTRIGITKSAELPLRFYLRSSTAVSKRSSTMSK